MGVPGGLPRWGARVGCPGGGYQIDCLRARMDRRLALGTRWIAGLPALRYTGAAARGYRVDCPGGGTRWGYQVACPGGVPRWIAGIERITKLQRKCNGIETELKRK